MDTSKGFTLIELVVAIAILVMIMSIAAVSYQQASERSRDGRRQADLEQVRTALEIYRVDEDDYPAGGYGAMTLILQGPPAYLTIIPEDPRAGMGRAYEYTQVGGGTGYLLCADMEGDGNTSPCDPAAAGTCGTGDCDYCTCNP